MSITLIKYLLKILIWLTLVTTLSTPVMASVTYTFVIFEQPTGDFHKPLIAEMVLSDEAVTAGQASNGQIESLVFAGGSAMQGSNRLTLAHLHPAFSDLTVNLSADRNTVTSVSATVNSSATAGDNWVFYYSHPPHPRLDIHEFLGYIKSDSVTLEATLMPVPPTTHNSRFVGEWHRKPVCWICRYICKPYYKWPFCWFDLIVIVGATFVSIALWRCWRKK